MKWRPKGGKTFRNTIDHKNIANVLCSAKVLPRGETHKKKLTIVFGHDYTKNSRLNHKPRHKPGDVSDGTNVLANQMQTLQTAKAPYHIICGDNKTNDESRKTLHACSAAHTPSACTA